MQYNKIIDQSITYIKDHINEELSAEKIANQVGYSTFHFCRIFSLVKGIPLMEYVRKYRLSTARIELTENRKILDVALHYGFESASGFSKSFRQEFGYTPTSYKIRMADNDNAFVKNIREVLNPPKIVKKGAFKLAGYGMHANMADNYSHQFAAYWDSCDESNLEEKLYEQLKPPKHGEVGVWLPYQNEGNAIYLFGVIVNDFSQVTSDMVVAEIPSATYAVFTTPPINNLATATTYEKDPLSIVIKETWRYIFTEWFDQNKYELDESHFPFEYYDERCHASENSIMEIYVPIKKA